MNQEIQILLITAASIGFFHTLVGPDHYLPFVVMGKARKWSIVKTSLITFVCGIGHVLSSVILGFAGIFLGVAVQRLVAIESFRGNIAAWALITFGLVYALWGLRKALRNRPHAHLHPHINGSMHAHGHTHEEEHMHVHEGNDAVNITPWVLFTIFVFGPCEPLIPLIMYPAARSSISGVILVTAVFGVVTICTMLSIVVVSMLGFRFIPMNRLERYNHLLAGTAIFISGLAIQFLGL